MVLDLPLICLSGGDLDQGLSSSFGERWFLRGSCSQHKTWAQISRENFLLLEELSGAPEAGIGRQRITQALYGSCAVQQNTLQAGEGVRGRLEGPAALCGSGSGHRRSLWLAEDKQTAPPGQGDASSQNKSGRHAGWVQRWQQMFCKYSQWAGTGRWVMAQLSAPRTLSPGSGALPDPTAGRQQHQDSHPGLSDSGPVVHQVPPVVPLPIKKRLSDNVRGTGTHPANRLGGIHWHPAGSRAQDGWGPGGSGGFFRQCFEASGAQISIVRKVPSKFPPTGLPQCALIC